MDIMITILFFSWLCSTINIKIIIKDNDKKTNIREGLIFLVVWSLLILLACFEAVLALRLGIFVLIVYCFRFKKYTLEKAIILTGIASFSYISIVMLVGAVFGRMNIFLLLLVLFVNILFSLILVKTTKRIREIINQSRDIQFFLITLVIITDFLLQSANLGEVNPPELELFLEGSRLNFIIVAISLAAIFLYATFIRMRYKVKVKEEQLAVMQSLLSEIERQYLDASRIRHDFQNIITSLDGFVDDEDWTRLKSYYTEKVRKESKDLMRNDMVLRDLHHIHIMEIKSIIAIKLMSLNSNPKIALSFECKEVIDDIPVNTVDLVRMIGILLDNAIEEVIEIGEGKLSVALFKRKNETVIIVQNSCRHDILPLYLLNQVGFTTKETGQGLGLSNLAEIERQYTNISVETMIEGTLFTQKVTIEERG